MQCRNCSGNEFRKTESGNYKCIYCGTLYHEEMYEKNKQGAVYNKYLLTAVAAGIIITAVVLISFFYIKDKKTASTVTVNEKSSTSENGTAFTAENMPEPEGAVISIDMIPDSIGNHYFLALCRNTGKVAIRTPYVTVRLYSGSNVKVGSGSGYGFMNDLNPGEITPVLILIQKPPEYSRYETEYMAERPFIIPESGIFEKRFSGEISDVSLKITGSGTSYKLKGKIQNACEYNAKYVQVAGVIYNSEKKVIGYGTAYINEKSLNPGDSDFFDIYITTVAGKPDHYKLYYDGMVD